MRREVVVKLFNSFVVCLSFLFFLKVFCVSSFKIPSYSMSPEIIQGDYVLVDKLSYGARIFNVFSALAGERVKVRRFPSFSNINYNDIIVFNFPYPNKSSKIKLDMMKYYIKRCIGISGDTIRIVKGYYEVNNFFKKLGYITSQNDLNKKGNRILKAEKKFYSYPEDSVLNWTIKNFGPLYIPKKGDNIKLDRKNSVLYKSPIEWELEKELTFRNDTLWQDNKPLLSYTFTHNYYFMAGDNTLNSYDSRYWGLLPDDFIVGKAILIWKSKDLSTDAYRWNRFMKVLR